MGFQTALAAALAFGVVGDILYDGPHRAKPGVLKGTAANIVVGRYFTLDASDGQYAPGGTGKDGGILSNPKALQSIGTSAGGPLAPTLVVPAGTVGEFTDMGMMVVALTNGCNIGDLVQYAHADGTLKAQGPVVSFTGEIAVTTGVLTVTAMTAGSPPIAVGMTLTGTGVPGGTVITALGTGTGGTGTYQTNIVTAVASTTMTSASVPDAGYSFIPGARVVRQANASAGITCVSLTGPL